MVTKKDINKAHKNWGDWRTVYLHEGPVKTNPLLANPEFFKKFLRVYSVGRTIQHGKSEKLRQWLIQDSLSLDKVLRDETGGSVDQYLAKLTPKFGTRPRRSGDIIPAAPRAPISLLSKIFSFLGPHNFIAWDTYARKGLNRELRVWCDDRSRQDHSRFNNYKEYIAQIARLMSSELGENIRKKLLEQRYPSEDAADGDRFHLRVLDFYLMRIGGDPKASFKVRNVRRRCVRRR